MCEVHCPQQVFFKFLDPCLNRLREIPPEAVGGGIFDSFFRYNFRREVGNDVISGMAVDYVGMDASVKFGDSRSRDIRRADFISNERT